MTVHTERTPALRARLGARVAAAVLVAFGVPFGASAQTAPSADPAAAVFEPVPGAVTFFISPDGGDASTFGPDYDCTDRAQPCSLRYMFSFLPQPIGQSWAINFLPGVYTLADGQGPIDLTGFQGDASRRWVLQGPSNPEVAGQAILSGGLEIDTSAAIALPGGAVRVNLAPQTLAALGIDPGNPLTTPRNLYVDEQYMDRASGHWYPEGFLPRLRDDAFPFLGNEIPGVPQNSTQGLPLNQVGYDYMITLRNNPYTGATNVPAYLDAAEISGLKSFGHVRCPIDTVSDENGFLSLEAPCDYTSIMGTVRLDTVALVENAPGLVDRKGEHYFDMIDAQPHVLFIPRAAGGSPAAHTVVVPVLDSLFVSSGTEVNGAPGNRTQYVTIRNLSLRHTTWKYANRGYIGGVFGRHINNATDYRAIGEAATSDLKLGWEFAYEVSFGRDPVTAPFNGKTFEADATYNAGDWLNPTAAINLGQDAFQIEIANNEFRNLGTAGVEIGDGGQEIVNRDNDFVNLSAGGVFLGAEGSLRENNPSDQNANVLLEENALVGLARQYFDSASFLSTYARDFSLERNVFADHPFAFVSMGWGFGANKYGAPTAGMTINRNKFLTHTQFGEYDSAAIYTSGPFPQGLIDRNYFYGAGSEWGNLFFDGTTEYIGFISNVSQNTASGFHFNGSHRRFSIAYNYLSNFWTSNPVPDGDPYDDYAPGPISGFPTGGAVLPCPLSVAQINQRLIEQTDPFFAAPGAPTSDDRKLATIRENSGLTDNLPGYFQDCPNGVDWSFVPGRVPNGVPAANVRDHNPSGDVTGYKYYLSNGRRGVPLLEQGSKILFKNRRVPHLEPVYPPDAANSRLPTAAPAPDRPSALTILAEAGLTEKSREAALLSESTFFRNVAPFRRVRVSCTDPVSIFGQPNPEQDVIGFTDIRPEHLTDGRLNYQENDSGGFATLGGGWQSCQNAGQFNWAMVDLGRPFEIDRLQLVQVQSINPGAQFDPPFELRRNIRAFCTASPLSATALSTAQPQNVIPIGLPPGAPATRPGLASAGPDRIVAALSFGAFPEYSWSPTAVPDANGNLPQCRYVYVQKTAPGERMFFSEFRVFGREPQPPGINGAALRQSQPQVGSARLLVAR